ncbi:hypothetical protein ACLIKD_03345 [Azonexus sp. IMCC34842]|uniref:hypothetical protein n=1 Tax=Azonexus sp. IMCC34842 TaxID=3420950 RepID=UPI003D10E3B0
MNGVLKGKLLENDTLVQQAANNTKEQFANSPDLSLAIVFAIMDALDAHGHEQPGAELAEDPGGAEGHPVGAGAVI